MGPVTLTLNQLRTYFLLPLFLPISQLSQKISQFYLVTKSSTYNSLIIISKSLQEYRMIIVWSIAMINLRLSPCYMTIGSLINGARSTPSNNIILSRNSYNPLALHFFLSSLSLELWFPWKTTFPSFFCRLWKSFPSLERATSNCTFLLGILVICMCRRQNAPSLWINMVLPKGIYIYTYIFPYNIFGLWFPSPNSFQVFLTSHAPKSVPFCSHYDTNKYPKGNSKIR